VRYLLDSNVCIRHLRSHASDPVCVRLESAAAGDVALCSVVVSERLYGALRSRERERNLSRVEEFVARFESLPFDGTAARMHAPLHADLAQAGVLIGPHDLIVASIALAHDLILVTHNTAEFGRVPNLRLEDWERTA
jgi:tRNA(fMet)-specific endonuclease VapC